MKQAYLLAADTGATNTRLRLEPLEGDHERRQDTVESPKHVDDLVARIHSFVEAWLPPGGVIESAVFGLPGKVSADRQQCAISYLDPDRYVDFGPIFQRLAIGHGILANDVECGVFGLAATPASQLELLCGERDAGHCAGPSILGMPGTGLGVGLLLPSSITLPSGKRLSGDATLPSEGGHLTAAIRPDDPIELAYYQRTFEAACVHGDRALPTWEHLLCGGAIPRLFRCVVHAEFAELKDRLQPGGPSPLKVSEWARSAGHALQPAAAETFAYYGRLFGRMMQSAALLVLAEGVYLGGDIVLANHRYLAEEFRQSFQWHTIHRHLLVKLPVWLVRNPSLNLDGATRMARDAWRLRCANGEIVR
jgi:glucokinase